MCTMGPQLQDTAAGGLGASQHICPAAHPAASPAGGAEQSRATGFHTIKPFQFWILHLQWSALGMRPVSSSTQLLLCHWSSMQTFFQKLFPLIRPMCSFSKKCSFSNILSITPQPALTLLVHSETTLFQGFSYHITGKSFQKVSCSKVN